MKLDISYELYNKCIAFAKKNAKNEDALDIVHDILIGDAVVCYDNYKNLILDRVRGGTQIIRHTPIWDGIIKKIPFVSSDQQCSKCKEPMPDSEFRVYITSGGKIYRYRICKRCVRDKQTQRRKNAVIRKKENESALKRYYLVEKKSNRLMNSRRKSVRKYKKSNIDKIKEQRRRWYKKYADREKEKKKAYRKKLKALGIKDRTARERWQRYYLKKKSKTLQPQ